jgi:hypothetical protein
MSGDDEELVQHPYYTAMSSLITRTENAVSDTPNLDDPASSIGEGPAWTGSKAREIHDDYLGPHADSVRTALDNLVSDVQERQRHYDQLVTESEAESLRQRMWNRPV